jgi:hypothetical protein
MNRKIQTTLLVMVLAVIGSSPQESMAGDDEYSSPGLPAAVPEATRTFRDVALAEAAGYAAFLGCVSGNQDGAMGVHYANGALVGDDAIIASQPEILVYEPQRNGRMRLVAVEYIVLAEAWHAVNEAPPVLMGQVFHYTGSPNRYGLPAFYALHVWAWKHNPNGMFVNWNPAVSCDKYVPDGG